MPVPEYLGTLSLYGHSARVYDFLHSDGRLRPFGAGADLPEHPDSRDRHPVLAAPVASQPPDPGVRAGRGPGAVHRHRPAGQGRGGAADRPRPPRRTGRPAGAAQGGHRRGRDRAADVIGALPVRPMSPNYFFRQLGGVLEHLIEDREYRYTGVFDVGRAGLSAVCNLPRTGPGFSGWFGRALMGDALQALPGVLCHRPDNVLAVVGDGAAALVPDIVPTLVRQVVVDGRPLRGNVSIFRCVNGAHSVIRTYRRAPAGGRQRTDRGAEPAGRRLGPPDRRADRTAPGGAGRRGRGAGGSADRPGVIDLYSVLLGHNNEGDGLSRLAALSWQRPTLAGARPAGRSTKDSG
ncbi:hypothetical protein NKG94_49345 [Micromonospora sp. M12]